METPEKLEIGDELLTSHQVGTLLQVNPSSIQNWVKAGRLPAFRTPGGHLRIRVGDLVSFLHTHKMPVPAELSGGLTRKRLVVVDDDAHQLRAYKRVFESYVDRLEVLMFDNGIDALIQVGAFRPNLIVLDVFMPEIDGIEVCRRLKANPATKPIDIIVTSGQLTAEIEKQALEIGVRCCLPKPLKAKRIIQELGLDEQLHRS